MKKEILNVNNVEVNDVDMRAEDRYEEFEQAIKNRFNSLVNQQTPIFTTNAEGLWETYLNNLSESNDDARQHYNCNCCRHFIQRYGNLVFVNESGVVESLLWTEDVPPFFKKSAKELVRVVNKSRINGVFISDVKVLGTPRTGIWGHLSATLPNDMVNRSRTKTDFQIMAEKLEDYRMINRALQEYSLETVVQALALLETESLYRSEKILGVAKWFKNLHEDRLNTSNSKIKENITWVYVAKAPVGFTHIKSSMIGTLLDDINDGLSFESISSRFAQKMNPNNFMRAQVAPTQGNIQQAEKIVEKMGIANSLKRRYATFEEVPQFIWKNKNIETVIKEQPKKFNVFANVAPKGQTTTKVNNVDLPTTVMTWDKFQRTIMPTVESMEVKVDNINRLMALVTASDETSENIMQWGNTFSWYYHGGIDGEIKRRVEAKGGQYENNEIRCSLIWENYTDLDLHCITPRGEHIYFSTKRSQCGGYLDIDENAGSGHTMKPVENIRWTNGSAREGKYRFYVNNFSERTNNSSRGATPYRAELEVNGKIYTFEGSALSNRMDETAFEFDYVKGQQPSISNSSSCVSSEAWNVPINEFVKVKGITISPNLWEEKQIIHSGNHTFFLLEGCKDLSEGKGRGFFTEMLTSELREIRKTLEAYCANTPIEDVEKATACGLGFSKDSEWDLTVKVTSNGSTRLIKIDRFD